MRIDLDITQGGSADRGTSSIARFRLSWHNLGVKLWCSSLKHEIAWWWWHANIMFMTWSRRSPDKKVLHHWFPLLLNLRFPQTLGTDQRQWWWLWRCWYLILISIYFWWFQTIDYSLYDEFQENPDEVERSTWMQFESMRFTVVSSSMKKQCVVLRLLRHQRWFWSRLWGERGEGEELCWTQSADNTWGRRVEKLALRLSVLRGDVQKIHCAPCVIGEVRLGTNISPQRSLCDHI